VYGKWPRYQLPREEKIMESDTHSAQLAVEEVETNQGVLFDDAAEEFAPLIMPMNAILIAKVTWSLSMDSEVIQYYCITSNSRHWFLWIKPWDDNWGRWHVPWLEVCIPKHVWTCAEAARLLIAISWHRVKTTYDYERFDEIRAARLLSVEDLEGIADEVWPDEENKQEGSK
jgi:hypothetical protein